MSGWISTHDTVNGLYLDVLRYVTEQPFTQPSRNGVTAEVHPAILQLTDVRYRSLCLPQRRKNLLLQLVEFLWIWNGSNQLRPVAEACMRWKDYSDDGVTLWGAYGKRLRVAGINGADQLDHCIQLLQRDLNSRQAVCTIWDGGKDLLEPHKDLPCNDLLHFLVRDGKLDLTVFVRSNDLWLGTPYNLFNWTQLQCVIASRLGISPGIYTHVANSLHLYEEHRSAAQRVLDASSVEFLPDLALPVDGASDIQLRVLWQSVYDLLEAGTDGIPQWLERFPYLTLTPYWHDYLRAIAVGFYCKWRHDDPETVWAVIDRMTTALKIEAAQAFSRWCHKHQNLHPSAMVGWLTTRSLAEVAYITEAHRVPVSA